MYRDQTEFIITEFLNLCSASVCERKRVKGIETETWFDEIRTSCHDYMSLWEERQEQFLTERL